MIHAEVEGRTFPNIKPVFTSGFGIHMNLFSSQGPLKKKINKKNSIRGDMKYFHFKFQGHLILTNECVECFFENPGGIVFSFLSLHCKRIPQWGRLPAQH